MFASKTKKADQKPVQDYWQPYNRKLCMYGGEGWVVIVGMVAVILISTGMSEKDGRNAKMRERPHQREN